MTTGCPGTAGRARRPLQVTGIVLDLLFRVSALVEAHPEIAELDCNPVKVAA